jgi:hypothetical protein
MGLLDAFGRFWARVEALLWWLWRRLRRQHAEIEAQARQIGDELLQIVDLSWVWTPPAISPVRRRFYGHGAYMGAAPVLLADAKWRRFLAFLMPDVYEQVRAALSRGAQPAALIPMFENNPVMAAFGVLHGAASGHEIGGMEWDVFLDGDVVPLWAAAPDDAKQPLIARIVDTMVIAHASSADTVQEHIGLDQWKDVRKTPKTKLGGVEPGAWLDLFGRALELARSPDPDALLRGMSRDPRDPSDEECRRWTFAQKWSVERVTSVWEAVTGQPRFSVVLEIKSLRSTSALLAAMVAELNRRGVHVAAVGSFVLDEVRGVGAIEQVVHGVALPGPRELLFLHFAGDLQHACDEGLVPHGQSVLFNGASLLDAVEEGPRVTYRVHEDVVAELAEYQRRYALAIGLYVQEPDCDDAAASLLSDLVHAWPETFSLGFAWGGLHDAGAVPSDGADRRGFGGQKMLGYVGRARSWRVKEAS